MRRGPSERRSRFLQRQTCWFFSDPWFAGTLLPGSLASLTDGDAGFRAVAARALGYLVTGKPKAHEDVINALNNATKDPDERVRAAATEALQRIRKGGGAD
jgi:hypothetical protein